MHVLPAELIPDEIMKAYHLYDKVHNGKICMQINKGICGLKEAGALANEQLQQRLAPYGYTPTRCAPGLWKYTNDKVIFGLIVDDFAVKYTSRAQAEHLVQALKDKDEDVDINWDGNKLCGINLKWNCTNRTCKLSIPDYIEKLRQRFNLPKPTRPQHTPADRATPNFGQKQQYVQNKTPLKKLPPKDIKRIQEIIGTILCCCRATEFMPLVALSSLSSQQSKATDQTYKASKRCLDYLFAFPDGTITYAASDMVLWVHSDGAYLVEPNAKSRVGGFFFLSDFIKDVSKSIPKLNSPMHVLCKILKNIVSSVAECEIGAAFDNGQDATVMRCTLIEMGHPQPPTPMQVDNTAALRFIDETLKEKRTKSIDMKYHWLKDREQQQQFQFYWRPGKHNMADPFTKNLSGKENIRYRKIFRL